MEYITTAQAIEIHEANINIKPFPIGTMYKWWKIISIVTPMMYNLYITWWYLLNKEEGDNVYESNISHEEIQKSYS